MGELVDLLDKIKRYFGFTPNEVKSLTLAILVTAFVFSFQEWGEGSTFNAGIGLINYFNAVLIVALSLLIHISVQRIWSLGTGYRLEWKMWTIGLVLSTIIVFLTNGSIWLILPGGLIVHHMAGHRLGWFRYDINYWAIGLIAATGIIASIFLAAFFSALSGLIINPLIEKIISFNIAYALYSLIPLAPLDGSRTFFGSRMLYSFVVFFTVASAVLLSMNISVWISLLASFFTAIALWLVYYITFEHKAWKL